MQYVIVCVEMGVLHLNHLQDSSFRLITFSAAMIVFVVSEEDILRVEKKTEGS